MGALDDLLNETEETKKKGGLDDLLRETTQKQDAVARPTPQAQGLDALLADTEQPQPRPTLTPSPVASTPLPGNIESAVEAEKLSRRERDRQELRAAGRIDSEALARKVQSGQPLTDIEARAWQEQSGQAIPTRELENAAILGAGILVPPAAIGVGTLGTIGGTAAGEAIIGAGINAGLDVGEALSEGRAPNWREVGVNALTGAVTGGVGGATGAFLSGRFGDKVRDVAKHKGTSPQQINKLVGQMASESGGTRMGAVDDLIRESAQTPEGARAFAKYMEKAATETAAEIPTAKVYPQIDAEDLLPSGYNEQAVVSDLTREPAKRTLKNINISRLDDDELSNLIDNAVRESPEFQIPNERVAHSYLQERAKRFGTGTIDKYLAEYNPSRAGTPEGDIRKIATEVLAAENVLKNHMEADTLPLAKLVAEGKGDREALRGALVTDLRLLRKTGGVSSEFGRALGSRRIKATGEMGMEQRFLRDIGKVLKKDTDLDHIAKRLSEIDVFDPTARELFLRDMTKATTRDKIDEFFYNSILSGPITQVRNFLGNTGTMIVREGERPIATTVDLARSVVTGKPRQRFYGESLKSLYGLIEGTREGIAAGRKSFSTEVSQFGIGDSIIGDLPRSRMAPAIGGRTGRIMRIPSRILMAADDFFKAVAYRMEINARAYREARKIGITNKLGHEQMLDIYNELRYRPTDALMQGAREEAILRTYQLKPGKIGGALIGARDNVPMLRYFMPFVRTPLNIMEFGVERVPGINLLSILNRRGQGLAVDWTEELAKTAMGTMIGAGVYLAYKNGIINGYGPQPNSGEEKAFYADGRQRYAFNINGTSVSFANFEPFTTILGMAADTMQLMDEGVPILSGDFAVGLGKALGRNVTGKPFGMGMDTFLNAISGDADKAERGIYRTMSSIVPFSSLARGVAIGLDPTKRKVETFEDALYGNIPGMRGDMMPVIDLWGREVVNEPGVIQRMASSMGVDLGLPGEILDAMADPSQVQTLSTDPATVEVNRLLSVMPDGESFRGLGTPSQTVKGEKLTREQYIEYAKLSGQRAHQGVLQIMSSPLYLRATDEQKKKAIEKQIDMARRRTRDELFSRPQ